MRGANQILPSSIDACFGWMSISVSQPLATPVLTGRTAQAIGSWPLAKSATNASSAASVANGP